MAEIDSASIRILRHGARTELSERTPQEIVHDISISVLGVDTSEEMAAAGAKVAEALMSGHIDSPASNIVDMVHNEELMARAIGGIATHDVGWD